MSVIEDMRKVLQDFLAPELRSMSTRMDALEKQRAEDKADLLRVMAESKADMLRAISDSTASMQKRFELVVDYTRVLQRMDRIEESQAAKEL